MNPSFVVQLCRTVKIQVGDVVSSTMEYQLSINCRASDLLTQFQRQSLRSPDNGKGKMRRCVTAWKVEKNHKKYFEITQNNKRIM